MPAKKIKYLVVDTNSFIKNLPLHEIGEEIYTIHEVTSEIRDKATRQRLKVLPYDIIYEEPSSEIVQLVTRFSKATGDYPALSAVDIKLMALAYQLTQEKLGPDGSSYLKTEPEALRRTTIIHGPSANASNEFPGSSKQEKSAEVKPKLEETIDQTFTEINQSDSDKCENDIQIDENDIQNDENDIQIDENDIQSDENEDESGSNCSEEVSEEPEDSDQEGWITPGNYKEKIREMQKCGNEVIPDDVHVACLTTDFAMQNVMMSAGVKVISSGGMLIKRLRTFILRCYACFRTTSIMTKTFCPSCGNKTLKRVSVSYKEDGTQVIHLSKRVNITGRGKKFPLPLPKGGKHSNNPLVAEDQQFPQQRPTKMALKKNNPLATDFIASAAPFATKDVYSRAAMLGINTGYSVTNYWDKKNPNASRKTTTGRKKKSQAC